MEALREGTQPHSGRAEGTLVRWDQVSGEVTPKIQGCLQAAGTGGPSPGLKCQRLSGSGVPARAPGLQERPAAADPEPGRRSPARSIAWPPSVRSSVLTAAPLPVAVAVATAVAAAQARFCEVLPLRHSSMAVTRALDSTNRVAMCLGLASGAPSRRLGRPLASAAVPVRLRVPPRMRGWGAS